MMFLDGCHSPELFGKVVETFFIGLFGEAVIHVCPFVILSVCGMKQINSRVTAYASQSLTP